MNVQVEKSHQQKLMLTWSDDLKRPTVTTSRFVNFANKVAATTICHCVSALFCAYITRVNSAAITVVTITILRTGYRRHGTVGSNTRSSC